MSRISKISLKDIIDRFDLVLMADDIVYFCNDIDVSREFINKFSRKVNTPEEVKEFLIKHEDTIDKEKFILLLINGFVIPFFSILFVKAPKKDG